ncbi:MAG: DUF6443 domain-containing protein, partial [Bacteroidetes bacterium]|nr:DUF6443 domain-containing protein [Bacteroidota bacterium]
MRRTVVIFAALSILLFSRIGVAQNVNLFDGSSSYTLHILPGVDLVYSSGSVPLNVSSENRDMQTTWVGLGWSLRFAYIEADLRGTFTMNDDKMYYVSNQGLDRIVEDASGVYRLENHPYWKVEMNTYSGEINGITIVRSDGSQMKFGDFQTGIGTKEANLCQYVWGGRVTGFSSSQNAIQICYRWNLSEVTDPYGVALYDYYYNQEQVSLPVWAGGSTVPYTRASYMDHIYNDRTGQTIRFYLGSRDPYEYQNEATSEFQLMMYETKYLDSISVFPNESSLTPIETWNFSYQLIQSGTTKEKRLLTAVTEKDASGDSLPSYKFSYGGAPDYLLSEVVSPTGGTEQFDYESASIPYLNQTTPLISAGPYHANGYQASSDGTVLVGYDMTAETLQIWKWIGTWTSSSIQLSPQIKSGTQINISVADTHVLIAYQDSLGMGVAVDYDWRYDNQQWLHGFSITADSLNSSYSALMAGISSSGGHIGIIAGDGSSNNEVDVIQWNPSTFSWSSIGTTSSSYFPLTTLLVLDDMMFYDNSDGCYLVQWEISGGATTWNGPLQVCTLPNSSNQQYTLQEDYIGRWDGNTGTLYGYRLSYDSSTGFQATTASTLGTGYASNSFPEFTDQRLLVCQYVSTSQASLCTWELTASGFSQLPTASLSVNWGSGWAMTAQVSDDWMFALNYRNGQVTGAPYDGEIYGFIWNSSAGEFSSAGTDVAYSSAGDNTPSFSSASLFLTNKFLVVQADANSLDPGKASWVDAFRLDRTDSTTWTLSSNYQTTYTDGSAGEGISALIGDNFIGGYSNQTGEMGGMVFHDPDKDWSSSVSVERVTQVITNDGMGTSTSSIAEGYSYYPGAVFDPTLTFAGYDWVKDSVGTGASGSTVTTFNDTLVQPRVRGSIISVAQYKQGQSVTVHQTTYTWSVYADPNAWYLYQPRVTTDKETTDGVTSTIQYDYNDSNGVVSKTDESLGSYQHKITNTTFGFSTYASMYSDNMLSEPYEVKTSAKTDSAFFSLVSALGANPGTIDHLDSLSFDFDQYVKYTFTVNQPSGTSWIKIGTAVGSGDILYISGDSTITSPDSFWAVQGTKYYIETYVSSTQKANIASINAWYYTIPGATDYLVAWHRFDYDATDDYRPLRTMVYDGTNWITTDSVVSRNSDGYVTQSDNVDKVRTSTIYGYNSALPIAHIVNSSLTQTTVSDFDDGDVANWAGTPGTWSVNGGIYQQTDGSSTGPWDTPNINSSASVVNGVFETDVRFDSGTYAYAGIAKYVDGSDWVRFELRKSESTVKIEAWKNGVQYVSNPTSFLFNEKQWYHLKGVIHGDTADLYIDGNLIMTLVNANVQIGAGNVGVCTYYTAASFDNIRMYPLNAIATSTTYDPTTLQVISTTDANGVNSYTKYDGFGRVVQTLNADSMITSEKYYYLSRTGNGDSFSSSDPNYTETLVYPGGLSTDGIIAWYDMNGEVQDQSDSGNNGSTPSGFSYGRGVQGKAFNTTGGHYIFVPRASSLDPANITIEAWVNPSSESQYQVILTQANGACGCGQPYAISILTSGAASFGIYAANGQFYGESSTSTIPINTWSQVTATYDGIVLKLYIDGQLSAVDTTNAGNLNYGPWVGDVAIGKKLDSCYPDAFTGLIDQVVVYGRALSSSEVMADYNMTVKTVYTDGIGRPIQTHVRDGVNDLITAVDYDSAGRAYRNWRPFDYNTSYQYDPSYSTHAQTIYGISDPYTERIYSPDPLSRDSLDEQVGYSTPNEGINYTYGADTLSDGQLYGYSRQTEIQSDLSGAPSIYVKKYFDDFARVVQVSEFTSATGGDTITTRYSYNFLNKPVVKVDPDGDSTKYTYNFLGELSQSTTPDGGTLKYIYDRAGRLRFMADADGLANDNVLYWKYDSLGRVIEKGYISNTAWGDGSTLQNYADNEPSWPPTPSTWRKQYVYDYGTNGCGNLVGRIYQALTNNNSGDTADVIETFSYDRYGDVTSVSQKITDWNSSTAYPTYYDYDKVGRVTQIDYPPSSYNQDSVTYVYDQVGRVTQVGQGAGAPFANYTYNNEGEMATEIFNPGGTPQTRTYSYDPEGRLTGIDNSLFSEHMTYTSGGYNNNEGFYHGLMASDSVFYYSGGPSALGYKFQYDNFGRLAAADNSLSSMDVGVGSPTTYDPNGNITTVQRGTAGTLSYNYYAGTNRLQNTGSGGNQYVYDPSGNMTSSTAAGLSYTYDPFTALASQISSSVTSDVITLEYGGAEQRVYKSEATSSSTTTTIYLHGGLSYPIMQKMSDGSERLYVYGPTGLIAMRLYTSWYYVHKDHLGSVRLLANSSGSEVSYYDYDVYGTT